MIPPISELTAITTDPQVIPTLNHLIHTRNHPIPTRNLPTVITLTLTVMGRMKTRILEKMIPPISEHIAIIMATGPDLIRTTTRMLMKRIEHTAITLDPLILTLNPLILTLLPTLNPRIRTLLLTLNPLILTLPPTLNPLILTLLLTLNPLILTLQATRPINQPTATTAIKLLSVCLSVCLSERKKERKKE
jgi:hypothetical protein